MNPVRPEDRRNARYFPGLRKAREEIQILGAAGWTSQTLIKATDRLEDVAADKKRRSRKWKQFGLRYRAAIRRGHDVTGTAEYPSGR
ncbi:MAG: hypothetical protein A3F70_12535 [Acidobacteria bacterium RIFCSPLOWO2_12_FULL_67_14]|nr:MAG: hypothetical protein A3H29_00780 [Acidobacteria bacterium RIFCSPLOWO2_02_FULL_67_21]OFW37201.1 MAG: hypothetical protein A3F70_12535 [Acidobacteria bacterium RIFCSPLOWO2_12_FULL_67_14]